MTQLYYVTTRAETSDGASIVRSQLLVNGEDKNDIARKARWFCDQASYKTYSITKIEKVKPGVHILHERTEDIRREAVEAVPVDDATHSDKQPTLQPRSSSTYAFACVGAVVGFSDEHVMRKVAKFIGQTGAGHNGVNPFQTGGVLRVEMLGSGVTSTRMSSALADISELWGSSAKIFQGGAVSPR